MHYVRLSCKLYVYYIGIYVCYVLKFELRMESILGNGNRPTDLVLEEMRFVQI